MPLAVREIAALSGTLLGAAAILVVDQERLVCDAAEFPIMENQAIKAGLYMTSALQPRYCWRQCQFMRHAPDISLLGELRRFATNRCRNLGGRQGYSLGRLDARAINARERELPDALTHHLKAPEGAGAQRVT
ncbi:hypothetical protein [Chitinasiproducens palmae]|uniref:Uncharacterized protein n=1 Tax=Chitinasiproducens palmae TaxID=1770053 RepID=A0A1H2PU86_9BURK|nr:hypothetical protein [Chitinasiproducens palmae]SDV49884.1 hypothetical protein SAMN05216551_109215 [Chitinasiproducens palmae]